MKNQNSRILVPTDFSENAEKALKEAIFFAKHFNSELILLHVIESYLINSTLSKTIGFNKERNESLREAVKEQLSEMAEKISKEEGLTVTYEISMGKSYKEIAVQANEQDVDFIIMGTHGATGMEKYMMGTNASRVASTASKPVITINGDAKTSNFQNLVLPLDLTKETREKVKKSIELAKKFNATIHVVSILKKKYDSQEKKLKLQMNQVINYIKDKNVEVKSEVIKAENVAEEIVAFAEGIENSALIIMTQQEMEITDFILGSQANRVIKHAMIPVVSVRPTMTGKVVFRPY